MQDAVAGPLSLLLILFAYYRLRPEGVEDGMTYGGEEWENKSEDLIQNPSEKYTKQLIKAASPGWLKSINKGFQE